MRVVLFIFKLFTAIRGFDGMSLLDKKLQEPISTLCAKRTIHDTSPAGTNYFFSWKSSDETDEEDFENARSFCRRQCMELVSLETFAENEYIKNFISKNRIKSVYTSGHICDFLGCDRPDLEPLDTFGWIWAGSLERLSITYWREYNDWSNDGPNGPQPDNLEYGISGNQELCLAFLNSDCDGLHWHDVTCDVKRHFICEDSETLLNYIRIRYPGLNVP